MPEGEWVRSYPAAITVCNTEGIISEMNDMAVIFFEKFGGKDLIGRSVLDCHTEPTRSKLKESLENQTAISLIKVKDGVRKLVSQAPWFKEGKYMGLVAMMMVLPGE